MSVNKIFETISHTPSLKDLSDAELLEKVSKIATLSLECLQKNNKDSAIELFRESLIASIILSKRFQIDVDTIELDQLVSITSRNTDQKTMHIYSDRVEIRVDNEVKGGWALWSLEDLAEAFKVAQEFNCKVIKEETFMFGSTNTEELDDLNG